MYTVYEMKEKLKALCDEVTVLEVLDIRMEELLDRFEDKIEANLDSLCEDFAGDFPDSDGDGDELAEGNRDIPDLRRYFEDNEGFQIVGGTDYDDEEE